MEIIYKNRAVQQRFDPAYQAQWRYPRQAAIKLLAMETFIRRASSLRDIAAYPPFHFHRLRGERNDEWSLYVGKTGYRVTVIPCDNTGVEIVEGDILAQCETIKILKVTEVSNHYE